MCSKNHKLENDNQSTKFFETDELLRLYHEDYYEDKPEPKHYIPIEELQISVRAYNWLKKAGINSVIQLLALYKSQKKRFLEPESFNDRLVDEVKQAVQQQLGITLPSEYFEK